MFINFLQQTGHVIYFISYNTRKKPRLFKAESEITKIINPMFELSNYFRLDLSILRSIQEIKNNILVLLYICQN